MTMQVYFDSFDLDTKREIRESIDCYGLGVYSKHPSPSECYICGRFITCKQDHSEYCTHELEE